MYKIIISFIFCFALVNSYPANNFEYDIIENEDGQRFYVVPIESFSQHERVRRQTTGSVDSTGVGISHTGTLLNNNNHRLDGTAFANKQFGGPITTGGNLDYIHKPTGSGASIGASNSRGLGTDFGAKANYNFYNSRDGRTSLGATGEYSRHFGGPGGTGRPNYGAFLNFNHRF